MVHVRFEGISRSFAQLPVTTLMDDERIKRVLAEQLNVAVERLEAYVIDRTENGDLIIRPEAVYG